MKVTVNYLHPLEVIVDTDTGEIERVVSAGSNIDLHDELPVTLTGTWTAADDKTAAEAIDIAECVEWPGWDWA